MNSHCIFDNDNSEKKKGLLHIHKGKARITLTSIRIFSNKERTRIIKRDFFKKKLFQDIQNITVICWEYFSAAVKANEIEPTFHAVGFFKKSPPNNNKTLLFIDLSAVACIKEHLIGHATDYSQIIRLLFFTIVTRHY